MIQTQIFLCRLDIDWVEYVELSESGGGDEWFHEEQKNMPDSMHAESSISARNNEGDIPLAQVAIEVVSTAEHATHINCNSSSSRH